jgi:hypothetical protein
VAKKFIYESIITIFGCPLTLINDQGTHFVNEKIQVLLKKFLSTIEEQHHITPKKMELLNNSIKHCIKDSQKYAVSTKMTGMIKFPQSYVCIYMLTND